MDNTVAPIPFRILKICGLWRPVTLSSWGKVIYDIFTVITLVVLITITLTVGIGVYEMPIGEDKFAENVFLMFALINAGFKAINILLSRRRIIRMLCMVQNDRWSKLRCSEEEEICDRYKRTIRKISIYFTTAVFIAIALRVVAPLLDISGDLKLPVDAYSPCNIENAACYWLLYWHQAIGTGVATLIHASKDCLISGLLLQTCFQLEILKHRLLRITETCKKSKKKRNETNGTLALLERTMIAECVQDHESIFEFAKMLNDSLNIMLFGQIAVTIPNLCMSIYLMSRQNIASMEFMMTTQFFSAVVIELFFFCWYGNEVTLHSLDVHDAVYEVDWPTLTVASRKELLVIMIRTSKPILFKVGPIMNMNIDSFLKIIKTSYSVFSVLQSTGK